MIRKLSLSLLDYENTPHCGGLTYVPSWLEITKAKFVSGTK